MFDKPGVFYSNTPGTAIFNNEWSVDYSKIENLKKHKLSILDFSSEHYGIDGLDYIYQILDSVGINFLLLSHDPTDHKKFDRMFFYPYWYHWAKKLFIVENNLDLFDRTYKWSCLNGNPRNHRIYNYFYSSQQNYFESACFSFYNTTVDRVDNVALTEPVLTFWEKTKQTLQDRKTGLLIGPQGELLGPRADIRCDLPALTDSYIHLISETTVIPRLFISEKTWKPIASGQIFLMFGNPGSIQYLRDQGVDVFDDIVDHSYDLEPDWQSRLHQIHYQLQKLIALDLKDLYINTYQRRKSNVEKFFSGAFDTQYYQTIAQCINMLS